LVCKPFRFSFHFLPTALPTDSRNRMMDITWQRKVRVALGLTQDSQVV
jgi:hypothetical protein